MPPIFGTPQLAITKILDFAEVLNIPKAGRLVTPVLKDDGTLKYKDGDNNCTLCKTWCCMNNPNGDPKLCVLFNKNLKIDTFPAQQQRFIRGGRKYLEENPGTKSMKDVRFPLEPIPGKGEGGKGGRGGGHYTHNISGEPPPVVVKSKKKIVVVDESQNE